MNRIEEDNALHIDFFMNNQYLSENESDCYSDEETNFSLIPRLLFENKKISFGFIEQSNNSFYEIITCLKQTMSIKHDKFLHISFNEKEKNMKCIFNVIDNYPNLILIQNINNLNFKNSNKKNDINNIIISFTYPPRFIEGNEDIPSYYLINNYNKDNNLRCFDCPFRNILIKDVQEKEIDEVKNQIFFLCRKNDIIFKDLKLFNSNDFFQQISSLNEKINRINKGNFYSNYITYANICENLQKNKFESVISIYENFQKNFKIKKYNSDIRKDKNLNSFFILKHISVTPSRIKIRKEMFHQSSRFLRLYYHNNNFIKIEFKDENDNQLYTTTDFKDFNKISKLSSLYDLVFNLGLKLSEVQYDFFLNPTNCMRSNTLWLLEHNESNLKKDIYYKELGSSELLQNSKIPFSKLLSRFSQNFTSTNAYNFPFQYEIIPDLKSEDGKYVFNDGCGMISKELMIDVCNKLNKGIFASAIQIRFKGAKGVLVINEKIEGRKILLTESMVKFKCENTDDLEIIRFSRYSPGFLNLQIIILLILNGIKKKIIYSIAKKEVFTYRNYKNNKNLIKDEKFSKVLKDIEKENKILKIQKDYMSKIAKSTYIYNRLCNISKKYRFHMKKCAFLIGVCDFDNLLGTNEVFIQLCNDNSGKRKIITGDVLITKNPCLSIYDLQKVHAIYKEEFKNLFYNVIIFPSKGKIPIPSKITGSDLDGDIYWVCWEKKLLHIEERDFSDRFIPLKNGEKIPDNINLRYHIKENGKRIRNLYFKVKTDDYNMTRDINNKNLSFKERCLDFHKFFHSNYKLPEVNRSYLAFISKLFKYEQYKNIGIFDIEELEKFAFYHSVEVDFQKAGETSNFIGEKISPTFLKKHELRKKSNILIRLKEIYDEYYSYKIRNIINIEFYEYLNQCSNNIEKEINKKNMTLYEKQRRDKDMYEKSFIYKLYELVSYFTPMQKSFISSIYLISEEYFYENNIFKEKKFSKFYFIDCNLFKEILIKVKDIVLYYESEIKYIMMENEIYIETELIYLTDFLEPKIPVFKNDIEDYKINLNEQIKFCVYNCISKLNELRLVSYKNLTKENIEDMIFIIIFWVSGNKILINQNEIDIDNIIERKYRIISRKEFIQSLLLNKSYDQMKYFYYEHLKCYSLYNFYCINK